MMKPAMSTSLSEATRVRLDSARSFDEVRAALKFHLGTTRLQEVFDHARAVRNAEEFEQVLKPFIGDGGFMLFLELDHSGWLPLYGITRRATRLIFGNPLIAITMIRHDIEASLFAPVELLLFEGEKGRRFDDHLRFAILADAREGQFEPIARRASARREDGGLGERGDGRGCIIKGQRALTAPSRRPRR